MQRYSIHNEEKVKEIMKENKFQPFRYKQIENAIYKNFITDFDKIETIPKDLRKLLKDNFFYSTLIIDTQVTSKNGQTTKTLYKTETWEFIESVIMRHLSGRVTLCVSCQAGCPMGCTFCATGKLGLLKNLESYEIIEQILNAAKLLHEEEAMTLRNVVYMGMGEPMLNYDNVKYSIETATNQKKLDLSNRRITVSTCWIVPWIEKFTRDFPQTSLAVSLHAPNDEVRKSIMPVDHTYPLDKLMLSLDNYTRETNKRIFYEYIMINWINDSLVLADQLGKMLKWKLAHVNFIPYNEWEGTDSTGYKTTPKVIIDQFQKILLDKYWVISTVRMTMWDDIDAACGQLANKKEEKEIEKK